MDADYKIKISSTAELSALKETEARLIKQVTIAKTLGAEYSKAAKELGAVQQRLSEFGGGDKFKEIIHSGLDKIPIIGEMIKTAGGGMAGLAAGFGLMAESVKEFAQAETAVASLDAALAQSGQLTDANREKFQALAGELQETTSIADEKWVAVLAKLVQFGSTAGDIEKNADAVKNLAGIMGGDLESSAMMVARAMQDNFIAFSRLGIKIDESLPQTEKLAKLYEELANRGAGQLEARAKTLAGQWDGLKNSTNDLFKAMGRGIAGTGALQAVLYGLGTTASYLAGIFGGSIPQVGGITNALTKTKQEADNATEAAEKLKTAIGEAKTEADGINVALGEAIKKLEQIKNRGDAESKAKRAVELAGVDLDEKSGKIDAGQAERRRAEINKRYDTADYQRGVDTSKAKIDANTSALEKSYVNRVNLNSEIDLRRREQSGFVESQSKDAINRRIKAEMVSERDAIIEAEGTRKTLDSPEGRYRNFDKMRSSLSEKGRTYFDDPTLLEGAKKNLQKLALESAAAELAAKQSHVGWGDQSDTIKALEAKKAQADLEYRNFKGRVVPENESIRGDMRSQATVFPLEQRAKDIQLQAGEAERERRRLEEQGKAAEAGLRQSLGGKGGRGGGVSGVTIERAGGDAVRGIDKLGESIIGAFTSISNKVETLSGEVGAVKKRLQDTRNP